MWVSWEIPPDPPFSKGGNVLLFSETCRHAILSGMRSENSLRISPPPPFRKGQNTSPFCKGGRGDFIRPKDTPNISPFRKRQDISPFCKGGRGDFHSRQVMVETEAVMEKLYRVVA
jgi:hypothetical protein